MFKQYGDSSTLAFRRIIATVTVVAACRTPQAHCLHVNESGYFESWKPLSKFINYFLLTCHRLELLSSSFLKNKIKLYQKETIFYPKRWWIKKMKKYLKISNDGENNLIVGLTFYHFSYCVLISFFINYF